ncbi:MAG: inorganic phosphate transporter [Sulfurovum sp.]|nr:inorganic phosphate transporter [Sulfurovum sp.]MDD3601941.1 inorganic phosphate transporter [Sulfurovum sp.]
MSHMLKIGLGAGFAIVVAFYVYRAMGSMPHGGFLVLAAVFGAYMAMNIGANDVANNVGPAVGAGALSIVAAIVIASVFEAAGALIAGGDVVGTIKEDIIDPAAFGDNSNIFVYAMSAALLAAALWLNVATWMGAPVSTTHSIVGGVVGAGIAAGGLSVVSWGKLGQIVASWVISPLMGGIVAAVFLYIIKSKILYQEDKLTAAKKIIPVLVALMAAAFITYLTLKGLKHVWKNIVDTVGFLPQGDKPSFSVALLFGGIGGVVTYMAVKPRVAIKIAGMKDDRSDLNLLFTIPLIFAAALLSFAHGANDVANAVGPLAAIYDAMTHAVVSQKAAIPLWVMVVGGLGISVGLALFGPRLIRTVGSEITELDQMRAFSIMMAAALTVVLASQLGLPVSSTHIAVGAVFGVGFLREWLDSQNMKEKQKVLFVEVEKHKRLKEKLQLLTHEEYKERIELLEEIKAQKKRIKRIKNILRENYVKRGLIKKIIAAWVITVPAAAILSAVIFYMLKGMGI